MAKLFYRYAAMNSGKSTQLLQIANNYETMGKAVRLYTAAIDNRYGVGKITSRLNIQRDALTYDDGFDFLAQDYQGIACVLIDEAQFLTSQQAQQLHRLAHTRGVPVICFGLRSDFKGEPFPGAAWLLALAEDIVLKRLFVPRKNTDTKIVFGTGGWRAVIGEGYTLANVRRLCQAIANETIRQELDSQPIVIGGDRRFLSRDSAIAAAEV